MKLGKSLVFRGLLEIPKHRLVAHKSAGVKVAVGCYSGAAGRIRTDDLLITNELLYP